MPFSIQNLLEGRNKPVSVKPNDPVQKALDLMIENDFSQLPVINDDEKPLGMVTSDSILRALNSFNVKVEAMYVSDTMTRADTFYPEDDLFDALDRLQATYAVLIIDREEKLVGIITNYDSAEYFRRRAEDMMLVEDIEGILKDYIRIPFTKADIEEAFGGRLQWDRLDNNRRSRLVVSHPGSVTDQEEKLTELRHWAVQTMIKFEQAIRRPLIEVVDEVFNGQ